ncbi:unnamed protein product [Medioppia subpectinata]|uniref:Guanine nucleotide exchange factor MSS4 n=1 Tax=Medioppia subpectinata TaxID=1979941 RepID=A0A7R9KBS0_9ACAR|nr:unnamed protein product [Medioppia subpectinata]CAG2100185.1 unnamed protein product [Medioppia subpectinata]
MSETTAEEELPQSLVTDCETSLVDGEGKNSLSLSCLHCDCLLLRPNIALFKSLPEMLLRRDGERSEVEVLSDFWMVTDMFQFENMAFSKNVEDVKYLACAECDIGPIGWHNLCDQKCYVALNRIKHH